MIWFRNGFPVGLGKDDSIEIRVQAVPVRYLLKTIIESVNGGNHYRICHRGHIWAETHRLSILPM